MSNANKKLHIITYGCQMNVYDSNKIEALLENIGYKTTSEINQADMVVMNTCNIREKAVEKLYSELGRIRQHKERRMKNNQEMIIVVAGCVGQAEGEEIFKRAPSVDILVGPQSYHSLPKLIEELESKKAKVSNIDFYDAKKFDYLSEEFVKAEVSGFLAIQEGCDKFCKFCVVPYTRGAEFSRPLEQIYREALNMTAAGAREITLLGQNVNAYHGKNEQNEEITLKDLINHLAKLEKIKRIRYTTSHPKDMDEDLIRLHGTEPKLMPFLHLPVQSGSDKILKSMNRKYDVNFYLEVIKKLREVRPDIGFSSDFIVGYPGETEEDFEMTLSLIEQVKFAQGYSFAYSQRLGTPACLLDDQIDEKVKMQRLHKLQALLSEQQLEFNQSFVGKEVSILLQSKANKSDNLFGKTPYSQNVVLDLDESYIGKEVIMKVTEASRLNLKGQMIDLVQPVDG